MFNSPKKEHFKKKLENVQKKIWDMEFLRDEYKKTREGFRMEYDRLKEMKDAFETRIKAEPTYELVLSKQENIKSCTQELDILTKKLAESEKNLEIHSKNIKNLVEKEKELKKISNRLDFLELSFSGIKDGKTLKTICKMEDLKKEYLELYEKDLEIMVQIQLINDNLSDEKNLMKIITDLNSQNEYKLREKLQLEEELQGIKGFTIIEQMEKAIERYNPDMEQLKKQIEQMDLLVEGPAPVEQQNRPVNEVLGNLRGVIETLKGIIKKL